MPTTQTDSLSIQAGSLPRAAVALAASMVLVAFIDLFTQLPITAPYARSVGATDAQVGIIVAAYSVTNLCGNMLAGHLLDRWGRRRPLLLGLVGTGLSLLLYPAATSSGQLMGVRAVHGLLAGFLTPSAFTIMADLVPKESRARAMGIGGAVVGLAAIAGPAISGILRARWGFEVVFFTVSALMFLAALSSAWSLPRVSVQHRSIEVPPVRFKLMALAVPCVAVFALMATLGILTAYLPLRLESGGLGSAGVGLMFTLFALGAVGVMVSPLGTLSGRMGPARPMLWGLLVVAASLLGLALSPGRVTFGAAMVTYGLGFGLIFPACNAAVAEVGGPDRRGRAFAILYAMFSVGVIAGASASGTVTTVDDGPFYLGAAAALAGVAVLVALGRSYSPGRFPR